MRTTTVVRAAAGALGALCLLAPHAARAGMFDAGLPPGWSCAGDCGTLGPDGAVTAAPLGGERYAYITTLDGVAGNVLAGVEDQEPGYSGTTLRSPSFSTTATGGLLEFHVNYVTSDGSNFMDYAWVRLLDASGAPPGMLFSARTRGDGPTVPGLGMPAPQADIVPFPTPFFGGAPVWSPLALSSGTCYEAGCGYTGWLHVVYAIPGAGDFRLEFGAVNWVDNEHHSGLAVDNVTLDGVTLAVPEPSSWAMLLAGLGVVASALRRRV
ncbi:NF038132 family protein [Pseudoduganella namucuonensis]|uniref:PEP-CTERM protein-sorting domain-containing protein n=1 Tax=Pseudoduganella namucuonensis TaxID=1035707 RepID=A0A1I7LWD7_9BURK|nr:NF038132 family protein [Pseudoduganella namucuonensis]SFV14026.1 PEP-CTERM protein-sorting domain-containing protein [Pseudoduganella namucuonensis]